VKEDKQEEVEDSREGDASPRQGGSVRVEREEEEEEAGEGRVVASESVDTFFLDWSFT
jgi:hypothetical protein